MFQRFWSYATFFPFRVFSKKFKKVLKSWSEQIFAGTLGTLGTKLINQGLTLEH
jgi:hypothetical protein